MKRLILALVVAGSMFLALMFGVAQAGADTAPQANCIGVANSSGQGEFASGLATTVPPPEYGQTTAEILGGPHGLIGVVASSNDCG
jgi:hypothetical protein